MKSIEEFLSYLCTLDIKISVEGDRLRCNAPQGKLTLDLQAQLSERKAEILAFLNQGNPAKHPTLKPIQASERDGAIPLSFAQQRLWFLDQLEGGSSTYNIPTALHLIGSLQVTTLERVVQEIVRRHEALRTNFEMVNGSPIQIIHPNLKVNMQVVDLEGLTEVEQSARVRQLITQEGERAFNLAHDPLLRVTLLRLAENSHVLLLVMHHIVSDGWSIEVFIRELSALYQSFSKGMPSPLPELLIQYADFTIWQRQWLQGEVLETQLNYWKQQLADAPPLLELPTDRPRPPVQSFRGGIQSFQLNRDLTQKLKRLSQQSGTTLFMTLLATFVTLLSRYCNQSDIIVGSPIANRNRSEIESLIGFFANTLVLRIKCSGNPSFEQLLQRVQQVTLDAYAHQDVPFEQLVEILQPERSLSHNPLFQVMFVFQNASSGKLELPGLNLIPLEVENFTAKFDLILSLKETEQELAGEWHYNSDLFDATTIARMVGHLQTMLAGIVAHPQQRISELPLLTEAELHQLLIEWNNTQVDYPQDKCIHQLFEEQVERTPDAVALVFEDEQLTYRELNHRANKIAHYLQALGVKPELLVGICIERSIEMVVALLGILKAGGAYMPLDPEYPTERLRFMLEDAQVSVLLTQQSLLERLPQHTVQLVCLDTDAHLIEKFSQDNAIALVQASNLAYVIYTSGSTGQPKGVEVVHHSVNRLLFGINYVHLDATQRFLQLAPISFDASTFDIWGALLHGAKCVLFPGTIPTSQNLREKIKKHGITILCLTAAWFNSIIDDDEKALSEVKQLLIGGEALSVTHVQRASEMPFTQIINGYGPTESTTFTCYYPIPRDIDKSVESIPIGRPIANTQIYILDRHLQPVPIGVPGELHIGGAGLARGYLNRPELTAEKFIPNPFEEAEGRRLYKTGDLARYLSDGNIEFLGRSDNQVKIRGFRIELKEIEAVLAQHSEVREVVVTAREDQPGNKRLVAYIVPNHKQPIISELRHFLKQQIPNYMIPSAFVLLETLPLTSNGKVDRKALPISDIAISAEVSFVAARDTLELQLTQIWEDVLNTHPIGVQHDFFDLGGHSLLAVHLMARIQQQFGKTLPLATLFKSPTIEQLAGILRSSIDYRPSSPLVAIQPTGKRSPFFCIHPGGGNVLCYMDLARYLGREQPFYGLQSLGLNGEQEPLNRIEDMAACYIDALQSVQPQGPYYLGGWSLGGIIAFEMAQQLYASGHQVALLALIDSYVPITINKPEEIDEAMLLASLAKYLGGLFGQKLSVSVDKLQLLEPEEQLNYILEQAKMLDILSPDVGLQQMGHLFKVFKANLKALYHYTPQPYPNRITLLCASEQVAQVTQDGMLGWSKLAAGGVETHNIPGDHYAIVREPHAQLLAERLGTYLDGVANKL
jgi:amino acid adenylation domain-containing protein